MIAKKGKGKIIPVTGRGGPWSCETSRLPLFLDNRLKDGGGGLSALLAGRHKGRKFPGTHFC
jgi:hypothetical protein